MRELNQMTDKALIDRIAELADCERASQVDLLRHLGELAERKLFLGMGYSSMWDYCRRALKFSESVSQQRILVARATRRHPELLAMLADGRLTLCTAADLVPHLDDKGPASLLQEASGKSRREIQKLTGHADRAVERDVIRRVGTAKPLQLVDESPVAPVADVVLRPVPAVATKEPAAEVRLRVAFTASKDVVAKLERLQTLLGDAALEEVVGKAADLLLNKVDPERREARRVERKVKTAPMAEAPKKVMPRRPPAPLRDKVMIAAGRRCEFVGPGGVRCAETRFLSIDHIRPYALGGTSADQSNLRCLCLAHNMYLGKKTFGTRATAAR